MDKYRFAFVVLHYNEAEVTKQCVGTILEKTKGKKVDIIIVDNCSPDGSGKVLYEKYKNKSGIKVILSDKNLGFAKGNNLGYEYARENLKADFICVMNNDVMLKQEDFIDRVIDEYIKSNCGVLGPHVSLKDGGVNFMYLHLGSREVYENERERMKLMYKYYTSKLFPIRNCLNKSLEFIIYGLHLKKRWTPNPEQEPASHIRHENIVLHGCCIIFTPVYIAQFKDGFNPDTFLFREEELLYLRCQKEKIKMVYEPSIDILHLEDVSTNAAYKTNRAREAFKCKCQIDSLKVLLEEYK